MPESNLKACVNSCDLEHPLHLLHVFQSWLLLGVPMFSLHSQLILSLLRKHSMCSLHESPTNWFLVRTEAGSLCVRADFKRPHKVTVSLSLHPRSLAFDMTIRTSEWWVITPDSLLLATLTVATSPYVGLQIVTSFVAVGGLELFSKAMQQHFVHSCTHSNIIFRFLL